MNRCAVTTLLAVAAIPLIAVPAAYGEITLTDASQTSTTTTTPGTTTPGTTTTSPSPAPSPGAGVPGEATDPNNPIESNVDFGSSAFKLGGALGSATTGSSKNGCTVLGSAAALGGLAGLGCNNPTGPGVIG